MSKEMQETGLICPWCSTEIVWDEEIGPEEYCPHCENELTGYRTLKLGENDADAPEAAEAEEGEAADWDEDDQAGDDTGWAGGGRPRSWLQADEKIQRIMDDQEEMPECPSCREYMLFGGTQQLAPFEPAAPPALKKPLLPPSPSLQVYVCPACHEVSLKLDRDARGFLTSALGAES
ncbi:hypothetical protein ACLBWT_06635 [Paenibacillus sp. D51F]